MMCLPVNSCCCCVSLEVGAQIMGIISTMVSASIAVLYGAAVALLKLPATRAHVYAGVAAVTGLHSLLGFLLCYGAFQRKPRWMWPWVLVAWLMGVVLLATGVAGAGLLVYGGHFEPTNEVNTMITVYILYSFKLFYFASVVNSRRAEMVREEAVRNYVRSASWKYV